MGMKRKTNTPMVVLPTRGCTPKKVKTLKRTMFGNKQYGVESVFFRLTKTTGVKLFPTISAAEFSRKRQARAAKYGIGPKVFSKVFTCVQANGKPITNPDNDDECTFGYITEVAHMRGYVTDHADDVITRVARKLRWDQGDLHDGNVGYLRNKPVMVDFGYYSF
jgi:hypothetical protein